MEREKFLERLRPTSLHNIAHPIVEIEDVPLVRYEQDLSDPIAAFTRNATLQGATVRMVDSFEDFNGARPDADIGIVGAAWGIAATGTVVFDAARAGGRSASLVPPSIVVLIREDRVLSDAGELLREMPARYEGAQRPSQLVLCSGPSKNG